MAAVRKFLFDVSFDEPEPRQSAIEARLEPEAVVETVAPTFSAEDVETARSEGYGAGREEAWHEASAAVEARIADALTTIGERLARVAEAAIEAGDEAARSAMGLAAAIVAKMFPELTRRHGTDEVVAVVAAVIARFRDEPRLTLRVDPALRDDIAGRIDGVVAAAAFPGTVAVVADPAIAGGDCRVEWAHGGAERNSEASWREIDTIIASDLSGPHNAEPEATTDAVPAEPAATEAEAQPTDEAAEAHAEPDPASATDPETEGR